MMIYLLKEYAVPRYYNRPEARVEIPALTASLLKYHPLLLFNKTNSFKACICCIMSYFNSLSQYYIYPIIQRTDFMTDLPARSSGAPYPHPVHFVNPVILSQP